MSLKKYCISNKKMNPAPDNDYKTIVNECHAVAIMDGSGIHLPNEAKTIKFCRKISSASLMTKKNALVRAMAGRMTAVLVCDALKMALWWRKLPKGVIIHPDRGSQYCSAAYQKLLDGHQLICSMSKKSDCYDNAAMESWNHSLKVEAIHDVLAICP